METFENKKIIAFTEHEIENLLACCNAAALYWNVRAIKGNIGAKECSDMANEYWLKLYHIKVGK